MLNFVLRIQAFYEAHYLNNATAYTEWAAFYGWLAAASLIAALITLVFVLFRREQARAFAGLIAQHILVIGVPWLMQPLADLASG